MWSITVFVPDLMQAVAALFPFSHCVAEPRPPLRGSSTAVREQGEERGLEGEETVKPRNTLSALTQTLTHLTSTPAASLFLNSYPCR